MLAYKIVDKNLQSVANYFWGCLFPPTGLNIQYKIDEWVEPALPDFPLYAFETLNDVYKFIPYRSSCLHIYRAEIELSELKPRIATEISGIFNLIEGKTDVSCYAPIGTIACSRIKLLNELDKKTYAEYEEVF